MDIEEMASRQADKRGHNNSGTEGLTTAEDLLKNHRVRYVTLSTGKKFRIQAINPGDFFVAVGSPLIAKLSAAEINPRDPEAVQSFINNMSDEEKVEIGLSSEHIDHMRRVVCDGVTSVNFSVKNQHECPNGIVSIRLLSILEVAELFREIMSISVPERDEEAFANFRYEDKEKSPGEGGDDKGRVDVRKVGDKAVRVTLCEQVGTNEARG